MNKKRPVNLDLSTIKFPIPAIVSITHRISGVIALGGILVLFWMLHRSLVSQESFNQLKELLGATWMKVLVWLIVSTFAYHLVMGVRHLIMDMGAGESLRGGRVGGILALVVAFVLIVLAGGWLLW